MFFEDFGRSLITFWAKFPIYAEFSPLKSVLCGVFLGRKIFLEFYTKAIRFNEKDAGVVGGHKLIQNKGRVV